jgi:hypothetical protein
MAAHNLPSPDPIEPLLGDVVLYRAAEQDDAAEAVAFPLCAEVDTFAAIVTRVHSRGAADLMILDPSKGPMPRWKVPFAMAPRPGHWTPKRR